VWLTPRECAGVFGRHRKSVPHDASSYSSHAQAHILVVHKHIKANAWAFSACIERASRATTPSSSSIEHLLCTLKQLTNSRCPSAHEQLHEIRPCFFVVWCVFGVCVCGDAWYHLYVIEPSSNTCTHANVYVDIRIMYICIYVYIFIYIKCINIYAYIYMYICTCIYIYMWVYTYVFIHIHTHVYINTTYKYIN